MLKDKGSKITAAFVLAILAILGWAIAPLFLPLYRWIDVDFQKEAASKNVPLEELQKEYDIFLFYDPRGEGDPAPWKIVDMIPEWGGESTAAWEKNEEYDIEVRCILISDKTGKPPSTLYVGSFPKDRYFGCKGWRFKPGSLGQTSTRPVVMFNSMSWHKLDPGQFRAYQQRNLDDGDDYFPEYDDEWYPEEEDEEEEGEGEEE